MDAEELQTTALAALESADVAVLKRLVLVLLPAALKEAERREGNRERTKRWRTKPVTDVTSHASQRVTSVTPSPFPPSPSFPPHPPNNPYPLTPSPQHRIAAPLDGEFADPDHRAAYQRFRDVARVPEGVDAGLRAVNTAMRGGTAYDWLTIGQALVEMEGAGAKFSAEAVRGFCRRLMRPPSQPRTTTRHSQRDQNLAALQNFLNENPNG